MSDLWHDSVPDEFVAAVWSTMFWTSSEGRPPRPHAIPKPQHNVTFLPIHTDTLARAQSLQSQAEQAGRARVAELNRQFADTVAHLIQRVSDEEHEALACQLPAPRDSEENQQNGVEHAAG